MSSKTKKEPAAPSPKFDDLPQDGWTDEELAADIELLTRETRETREIIPQPEPDEKEPGWLVLRRLYGK